MEITNNIHIGESIMTEPRPKTKHAKMQCIQCHANATTIASSFLYANENGIITSRNHIHDFENFLRAYGKPHCSYCLDGVQRATYNLIEKPWSISFKTRLATDNLAKIGGFIRC